MTGMVSTLLTVPEPLDDWLAEVGPLDELEPCGDLIWDGDRVDWLWVSDWDERPSGGTSSDMLVPEEEFKTVSEKQGPCYGQETLMDRRPKTPLQPSIPQEPDQNQNQEQVPECRVVTCSS